MEKWYIWAIKRLVVKTQNTTVTVKCTLEVSPRCRTPAHFRRFWVKVKKMYHFQRSI